MAELTFTNPSYLWILLLVPLLVIIHFFTLRQSKTAILKFANFEAIERVARGDMLGTPYKGLLKNKNIGLLLMRAVIYFLLIMSVAGTIVIYQGNTSNFDYVIAIDASTSMLADDFKPTRFEAARESAYNFVDILPKGASVGIVTFASASLVDLRPTSNIEEIKNAIAAIEPHESGGTAIGDAIITSANIFSLNNSKAIILLTDGQSNVGIDPETALDYAKKNDIVIHSVGVATKEGGNVSGINLISKIDEELLVRMSNETNGKFFIADNPESMKAAFRKIASSTEKQVTLNISWMLLVAAIALLGLEWIFINTIYKTIP